LISWQTKWDSGKRLTHHGIRLSLVNNMTSISQTSAVQSYTSKEPVKGLHAL